MKSSTKLLCHKLDELGIEYVSIGGITNWEHAEYDELADGSDTRLIVLGATPEQAIAATVGGSDVSALRAKVKAQSDYIGKLRGEYEALDEQMECRCAAYRATIRKLKAELDAATVGNRTDLAKRLREVTGLHSFAELFGFSWEDESDWAWHDVACAMADEIDAATGNRSCASCPEMDNPDSYISHIQSALKWHDEHVPRPTHPMSTCVVLEGEKVPEEVLFIGANGVTHYLPEATCKQEDWSTEGDHARAWLTCGHDCMVETVADLPKVCPECGARVIDE